MRCCGGHSHVRIQGSLTKPSATYVDGLALHVATAFRDALRKKRAEGNLEPETQGHETALANDVMLSSKWSVVRAWFWKRLGHINVLETSAAVSNLVSVGQKRSSCRFCHFVDSAVCRGALSKGRSPSRALQPLMRRAGAVCVASDLYPGWFYCPTRLNTADDPTRDHPLRPPLRHSLIKAGAPLDLLRRLNLGGLRRFAANWIRLILLAPMDFSPLPALVCLKLFGLGLALTSAGSLVLCFLSLGGPVVGGRLLAMMSSCPALDLSSGLFWFSVSLVCSVLFPLSLGRVGAVNGAPIRLDLEPPTSAMSSLLLRPFV